MNGISGYILAGGASTRMGQPKRALKLAGRQLVEIAYDNLKTACTEISIVVKEPIPVSPYRQICDTTLDGAKADGPLVAISTALSDTSTEWNFVLACDLPLVTPELLEYLVSQIGESVDAIVPIQDDGRAQPLCGLFRRTACLDIAEQALKAGKRSPMAMLERVSTRFIEFSEIEKFEGSTEFFLNLNTPEDLERAITIFAGHRVNLPSA